MRIARLFACIALIATASNAHASHISANLNLGGATASPNHLTLGSSSTATCPMVQLQVRAKDLVGPVSFSAEVRHAFNSADKKELYNKSRYCFGADVPVARDTFLFAAYEKNYHSQDDWAWCGISFRLR